MRNRLGTLGLFLVAGCTDVGTGTEDCLPGDKDCAAAAPQTGGKADTWNIENDPRYFAESLEYKLAALPRKGFLEKPVWKDRYPNALPQTPVAWSDTYWPSSEGSHNARWLGPSVKSPLEKYDAAFNNAPGCASQPESMYGPGAKAAWDAYYACAGPAAKWQLQNFQGIGKMHNGIDDDGDGIVDGEGTKGVDGVQGWWGTCHAWTPASLMMPEPQHAVNLNGQRFEVADIKALTQNIFDRTSAVMLGGRCNDEEISHDVNGSANDQCADVNPGALHVIVTNFLGLRQAPLIEDRTANFEVWNQPILGYEVLSQAEVSKTAANACVGSSAAREWKYNTGAKKLYEVRMKVTYLSETTPDTSPVGWMGHTNTDTYHYVLEISEGGKILGGRYCADSTNTHVDFLWSPTGSNSPSNPNVDRAKVEQLIKMAVEPEQPGASGTSAGEFSVTPGVEIPDGDAAGVLVDIPVRGVTSARSLAIAVDIAHPYRGDLSLEILKDGKHVKLLVQGVGGGEDDLKETFMLAASEIGANPNGVWTLKVVDDQKQDVGKVNKVTLSFSM